VVFQVPVKSFKFEKQLMKEHFNENYMESDKYPRADYKGVIADLSKVNFAKDGTYNVTSNGKLTIHGVTKDVTAPGTITVKGSSVTVNSKFSVKPADYKISIPKLVEGKIANSIEVTVNSILEQK
jgi:polyisoprenoid-binding protein YceI